MDPSFSPKIRRRKFADDPKALRLRFVRATGSREVCAEMVILGKVLGGRER
jgi:hypothetical protein